MNENLSKSLDKHQFVKEGEVYRLRIHELIYLEIDQNGFATLIRQIEWGAKKRHPEDKITIPKPVRTDKDLDRLMEVMI